MTSEFFQEGPALPNQYDEDVFLRSYLARVLPEPVLKEIEPGLRRLGERTTGEILALGDAAEATPPKLVPYDPWGRRIDTITVSDAWRKLGDIAVEEKLVATAYERRHGAWSRLHQFVRIYLYGPSSAIYTCPLAMTDGAARAIELYGDAGMKQGAYRSLTATDPRKAWTSGQWMTEKTGGSDVSGTSTIAKRDGEGFKLFGTKWFTSATTSEMAMALARIEGAPAGSRGLSLFFIELRDSEGRLKNIRVHRLKDKLGTKALPTAELTLEGTPAILVGGEGDGVKKISALFNITRIWNACCAAGFMRRGVALAKDYAQKRVAFGRPLKEQPLHVETLAALEVECTAACLLVFRLAELLGKEEMGTATKEETVLLRLLTPVAKLFTAKQAVATMSEVLESFGGAGYIEDTGLPKLLRDAQVLPIWEGTTNVLSLDMLRALQKEQALEPFLGEMERHLKTASRPELMPLVAKARDAAASIAKHAKTMAALSEDELQASAKDLAFAIARSYVAALMIEQAQWELAARGERRSLILAERWCAKPLCSLEVHTKAHLNDSTALLWK